MTRSHTRAQQEANVLIYEMPQAECSAALDRTSVGRIGCCVGGQPYIVPIFLAYEAGYFYGFSTLGQKIKWMRANPNVCVEVDEIANEFQWMTVMVTGRYEELPEPRYSKERAHARDLLSRRYRWWQNAAAEREMKSGDKSMVAIFFRISVQSMSGLRASDEPIYGGLTA